MADYEDFCVVDAPASPSATAEGGAEDRARSLDSRALSSCGPPQGQSRGPSTWGGPSIVSSLLQSADLSSYCIQCEFVVVFSYVDSHQFDTCLSNGGEVRNYHTASIELKQSSSAVKSISVAETRLTNIMSFKNTTHPLAPGESYRRAPWSVLLWLN